MPRAKGTCFGRPATGGRGRPMSQVHSADLSGLEWRRRSARHQGTGWHSVTSVTSASYMAFPSHRAQNENMSTASAGPGGGWILKINFAFKPSGEAADFNRCFGRGCGEGGARCTRGGRAGVWGASCQSDEPPPCPGFFLFFFFLVVFTAPFLQSAVTKNIGLSLQEQILLALEGKYLKGGFIRPHCWINAATCFPA